MPKFHPALRPFFSVYLVTLSAMVFDFWLISAMPQGIHLTKEIIISLSVGLVLSCRLQACCSLPNTGLHCRRPPLRLRTSAS